MIRNKILGLALAGLTLMACNDNKKQEQDLMNQVIKLHDEVMSKDAAVMHNKMLLDSLVKTKQVPDVNQSVTQLSNDLNNADKAMENWMHQFSADNEGKSHEQIISYLTDQKNKLQGVDQQITTAVSASNVYLSNLKK
jgi:DNA-binding HxlR family transcriptional regulator